MARSAGNPEGSAALRELTRERLQARILGVVQGVGFRPFVYRLARSLGLCGFVRNDGDGVTVEVEGERRALLGFLERLPLEKPAASILYAVDHRFVQPTGASDFQIVASEASGKPRAWILPDLGICDDCRAELLDHRNRRHGYPFINCTHCGPRFTIIEGLPYDRPQTSMRGFVMCPACRCEYEAPTDRRFHAQPNACADCGPRLSFRGPGEPVREAEALRRAVELVEEGGILALKGLGGYHIIVDGSNEDSVRELRRRKRRPFKPLALMYPDLDAARRHVRMPATAATLLSGPQAPIVLLPRTAAGWMEIAPSVAVESPHLGVFLPYTPLHVLLMQALARPVVATSGNQTDEPTLHRDEQAVEELRSICDGFLLHDRPIVRQADDSVLQILERPEPKPQSLRRARGYAPLPLLAPRELPPILALGGQMNAVFALSRGREVILSQHLGDLGSHASLESYRRTLEDFLRLYAVEPRLVVHDLHPDYATTAMAEEFDLPRRAVQHHHAHLAACMLENQLEGSLHGLCWDGTGFGPDGTVWGGEILSGDASCFERVGSLVPFRLPGASAAVRESWRSGLSLLVESFGEDLPRDLPLFAAIPASRVDAVQQLLRRDVQAPVTTSMGRLFDGVAAILGLSYANEHQAQSPQLLEAAAWRHGTQARELDLPLIEEDIWRLDWRPLIVAMVEAWRRGESADELAAAFHFSVALAGRRVLERLGSERAVLAGGVFCNRYLTESLLTLLEGGRCRAYVHSQLPPTDGSLAAGQLWIGAQLEGC